jgi:hypothetical protein
MYFKFSGKLLFTIFLCSFLFISCSNKNKQNIVIGEKYFLIKDFQIDNIYDIGQIEKIIKPEISDDSLFGYANRVRIDKNGYIFLLDEYSQQALFRFDQKGKFLNRYGRRGQGPGEYQTIRGFDFDSMGNVYLLTVYKIIKYKKTGEFLEERKINIFSGGIKIIQDELFLDVMRNRSIGLRNKSSVYVYNTGLKKINEFGVYEKYLMKYIYSPSILLSGSDRELYFIDTYNLCYNRYDIENKIFSKYCFSSKNDRIESIWNKSGLSEEDRMKIKLRLHRFDEILYYKNNLFVTEICRESNIYKFWLVDLDNFVIRKYSYFKLINSPIDPQNYLNFNYIAGSYQNGLILVIDDSDRFTKYKNHIKGFQNFKFTMKDNPLIIFFKLKG